ncbi:cell wall hydrolase [Sphingomonas hengshuiensis]|uniref:Cell wall hydrolase n=1 Tax=Sphingomonas hengshuiensis TaxID=1609977 RepID=A0A7U4JB58_9SPHN|nr:cell wall hydrolase [Sphingomonas hengshuiensis]AJP73590.1 cell wall hydrolase [Sphingomonas hengshuiensis]
MKFLPRAATFAALTFCAGALANAATLDPTQAVQQPVVDSINPQEHHVVPAQQGVAASLPATQDGEIVQPLPQAALAEDQDFETLSAVVAAQDAPESPTSELNCLAVGVYYEAKGEPLAGQLAVAEVILNRTTSGRFPKSVCSVVAQPGQFSFVRGGKIPNPPANAHWRKALAVAQVAQKDLWDSPAEKALYFHARYVRPSWKRATVATIGNHIFYR